MINKKTLIINYLKFSKINFVSDRLIGRFLFITEKLYTLSIILECKVIISHNILISVFLVG